MERFVLRENCLGLEIHDGTRFIALYRVHEELPRSESPKPCFAPLYTPSGSLITEYRPADHPWHTGLYFGWVHVNDANLWGGPWYIPEKEQYEHVEQSHGLQRHERFADLAVSGDNIASIDEELSWLNAADQPMACETRSFRISNIEGGYRYLISTRIEPAGDKVVIGASRAARYSGLELRMGPPFANASHYCSEGRRGHEEIMRQRARWVGARGNQGGFVAMMDHSRNPRHPVTWFTRKNLLGAGLLMEEDLELNRGEKLELNYAFFVFDTDPGSEKLEALYTAFSS